MDPAPDTTEKTAVHVFDIKEIKVALVLSFNIEQLKDYYINYSSFRDILSDPHTLRLLSLKFKIPPEKIKTFEDFIYSESIHHGNGRCMR